MRSESCRVHSRGVRGTFSLDEMTKLGTSTALPSSAATTPHSSTARRIASASSPRTKGRSRSAHCRSDSDAGAGTPS